MGGWNAPENFRESDHTDAYMLMNAVLGFTVLEKISWEFNRTRNVQSAHFVIRLHVRYVIINI